MGLSINWAKLSDVKDLSALDIIAHKEDKGWDIQPGSDFKKVINKSKFLTLIARKDGKAVAYLQSGLRNDKAHAWIENLFVVKGYRKSGIARALMNKFISHWVGRVDYIVLLALDKNMDVFRKLGFEKEINYMGYKLSRKKVKAINT